VVACCNVFIASGGDNNAIINEILHPQEGGKVYTPDEVIPHVLSTLHSTSIASSGLYIILEKWLDTCGSVERLDESSLEGADMSHKVYALPLQHCYPNAIFTKTRSSLFYAHVMQIFEADQSNLFEENTIFSRALSYSLAYNLFLLPTHWTIPICVDFVRRAWNAMSTIGKYVKQCQEDRGNDTDGWIGGFSYHPERFEAMYNSLSGAAFLCVTVRNPVFMEKKRCVLLQGARETEAEAAAARSLCVLLQALGSLAKSLCRDIRGVSVEDVQAWTEKGSVTETEDATAADSTRENEEAAAEHGDVALLQATVPVAVHPLLLSLLVDIAGPAESPQVEATYDMFSSCAIL
jgi:hypothetical protein